MIKGSRSSIVALVSYQKKKKSICGFQEVIFIKSSIKKKEQKREKCTEKGRTGVQLV